MAAHSLQTSIKEALLGCMSFIRQNQASDGSWSGKIRSDARVTAFYLITRVLLEMEADQDTERMERFLISSQLDSGAWPAAPNGDNCIDVTIICYLALRHSHNVKAQNGVRLAQKWLSQQNPPNLDSFWLGLLALNQEIRWDRVPYITPRLVSSNKWFRPNIYDFSFLRTAVVATCILQQSAVSNKNHQAAVSSSSSRTTKFSEFDSWWQNWLAKADELNFGPLAAVFKTLKIFDKMFPPTKSTASAIDWLLNHQEEDGSFFSSVHMTMISLLALNSADSQLYKHQIHSALSAMEKWQISEGSVRWQQFCDGTNWDTILFLDLLIEQGEEAFDPAISSAVSFLVSQQNTHAGDWSQRTLNQTPGGWSFQRSCIWYPDCDDTALAATTLLKSKTEFDPEILHRAIEWLLGMQSSNGGWASWDRNDRAWLIIPHAGAWFANDHQCTEISARILMLLNRALKDDLVADDKQRQRMERAMKNGTKWLLNEEENGLWFGSWFTHYVYGTSCVVETLSEVDSELFAEHIERASLRLLTFVNQDGGFGESAQSSIARKFVGAESTAFHTACALITLVRAGFESHPVARGAVEWLLRNQSSSGAWVNEDYFAAGVPGLWYAAFEHTPTYYAAKSLSLFKQKRI